MNPSPNPYAPRLDDAAHAARLWPDNLALQAEWLRAIDVVRRTTGGWRAEAHLRSQTLPTQQH